MNAHAGPSGRSHAIGVDLGGTKIEAIVLDPHGASAWRERVATPAGDYAATLAAVAALVARAEADLGLAACNVGIGTPGTATREGLIKNANSTCLNGRPLAHDLAQALGRPVRIANPVNPLLSAPQIAEILRAANTKVLVVTGPMPGSDIWDKVQRITEPEQDSLDATCRKLNRFWGASAAGETPE